MKQTYVLFYRTGWGESVTKTFQARNLREAHIIAKNYCTHNFIHIASLKTETGAIYCI